MAATSQKKSGGKNASGTAKRAGTSSRKSASAQPQKRPIRREVSGCILLLLALCVFVSYFGVKAILIDWMALLLKGLLGYGYWLTAPAMLMAGLVLLFHHGRPVRLRVTSILLLPMILGSLCHMIFCDLEFESGFRVVQILWSAGIELTSGGVLAGALAEGSMAVFSKVASLIIFTALLVILLMIAFRMTVGAMIEKSRNRPRYEEEELPEPKKEPAKAEPARKEPTIHMVPIEEPPRRRAEQPKMQIDIPLDDEPLQTKEEKKPGLLTGFFRQKSEHQKTPDELLAANKAAPAKTPAIPAAAAESAPIVLTLDSAAPAAAQTAPVAAAPEAPVAPVSTRKEKAAAAAEVQKAADAVGKEIEQSKPTGENLYQYPSLSLLNENAGGNFAEAGAELRNHARRLSETLSSFGVDATPGDVVRGPSVTRYEFVLDQGVKLSKITNLSDDIALALGSTGVRIAPIPDKSSVVGIEVPNKQVTSVLIRDVLGSRDFREHKSKVAFAVGKDIGGNCIVGNIAKLPHVLIAGTTGSGKSVCTNSLIVSLLYKSSPEDVRFIMVDPKMVELAPYNGIPHLLIPVVTDPKKAAGALQWAVFEMMKRYKIFSEHNVKDLEGYNALAKTTDELEHMASLVVVIDELADLMLVAAKEVEESICRVAQMGRAAGVHLVIATQRPSADVITGLMKANIPSRIAFAVASSLESRIILDNSGAEKLIGKGDMLYAPLGIGKPMRVQGCFISPEEIERVVEHVKKTGETQYSDEVMEQIERSVQEKEKGAGKASAAAAAEECESDDADELLPAAVDVVLEIGQASVSMLQRRLKLGYSRAARLVDQMEERGIVGPFEGSKPRQLLITKAQWQEMQMGGTPAAEQPLEDLPAEDGDDVPF